MPVATLGQKLEAFRSRFIYGRPITIRALRALADQLRESRALQVEALILLGEVLSGKERYSDAVAAYDEAYRHATEDQKNEILLLKAQDVRWRGVEEAWHLLQQVKQTQFDRDTKIHYWEAVLNTAICDLDVTKLEQALKMLPKRYRRSEELRIPVTFCKAALKWMQSKDPKARLEPVV